jgi:hypothetical protein
VEHGGCVVAIVGRNGGAGGAISGAIVCGLLGVARMFFSEKMCSYPARALVTEQRTSSNTRTVFARILAFIALPFLQYNVLPEFYSQSFASSSS